MNLRRSAALLQDQQIDIRLLPAVDNCINARSTPSIVCGIASALQASSQSNVRRMDSV
jgi:hypothetical protein